jgi:ankyrin repeat protein
MKKHPPFHEIVPYIRAGNVTFLEDYIRDGGDPSCIGDGNVSLLMEACRYKQLGIVDQLLRAGADTIQRDLNCEHALHYALNYSRPHQLPKQVEVPKAFGFGSKTVRPDDPALSFAIVELLVDRGVPLNPDKEARLQLGGKVLFTPPLSAAARLGHRPVIDLMIAEGADVDAIDYRGETPLLFAIREGRPDGVLGLLEAGADVGAIDGARSNAFHQATRFAAQRLREHERRGRRKGKEPDPVGIAALCERFETVMDILIEHGVRANSQDARACSPWDSAAVLRAADRTFQHMASLGCDLNAPGQRGTVLHLIATMAADDEPELMRMALTLLRLGADQTMLDVDGKTAAQLARDLGRSELAVLLMGLM